MRFILFTVLLVGCAHTTASSARVNVAAVRHAIDDSLRGERTILSMGHVDGARAVVYTEGRDRARHEETWVHGPSGWTLAGTTALTASN